MISRRAILGLTMAAVAGLAIGMPLSRVQAAGEPRPLKWADLIPRITTPLVPAKPKPFFDGARPAGEDGAPPPPRAEGAFMSMKRRQPGADRPPALVTELSGTRVSIGGYVVPLDFEQTSVKEFLLVPFVGACIHVPPPPANQIIYVKASQAFALGGLFDPVTVTGTLKAEAAITGLADAGYTLEAEAVVPAKE